MSLSCPVGTFLKLDSRVNIFGVLSKDDYIKLFGVLDRRWHAVEIANRAHTGIEIKDLTQRHVERTDAATYRSRQRPFDGNREMLNRIERALGQPLC